MRTPPSSLDGDGLWLAATIRILVGAAFLAIQKMGQGLNGTRIGRFG